MECFGLFCYLLLGCVVAGIGCYHLKDELDAEDEDGSAGCMFCVCVTLFWPVAVMLTLGYSLAKHVGNLKHKDD